MSKRPWIRNLEAGMLYETFLVFAIATVLGIRFFLRVTGYPQLGGNELHIAHVFWGGLLMLVAVMIQLGFLGRAARWTSAMLGGIGFGTFIDEVGKFITQDNDYFYRPAAALIYLLFILLYLTTRRIRTGRRVSPEEYLINALQEMEEVALIDLDEEERRRARRYLAASDPANPLVQAMEGALGAARLVPTTSPPWYERMRALVGTTYQRLSVEPAFHRSLILFFSILFALRVYAGLLETPLPRLVPLVNLFARSNDPALERTTMEWLQLTSALFSAGLILVGIFCLRRSRLQAYGWFKRSVLVSIFLTQVFLFYREQFLALTGLALHIALLFALDYAIEQERNAPGPNSTHRS